MVSALRESRRASFILRSRLVFLRFIFGLGWRGCGSGCLARRVDKFAPGKVEHDPKNFDGDKAYKIDFLGPTLQAKALQLHVAQDVGGDEPAAIAVSVGGFQFWRNEEPASGVICRSSIRALKCHAVSSQFLVIKVNLLPFVREA